jgi:hypothetical protein
MEETDEVHDENHNINIKISKKKLIERERELKYKQITTVPSSKKLRSDDLHRIIQHTDNSIFDDEKCSLWTGYITNLNNKKKGTYVNFYFKKKKKVPLHRLLYANFKGHISDSEYIKYSCPNKGICCNINHMIKFTYSESNNEINIDDDKSKNNYADNHIDKFKNKNEFDNFKILIY